jgi:perosamine synthetase
MNNKLSGKFIPISKPCLGGREVEFVDDAMRSGWISSSGSYISKFEELCASYIDVKHGVATTNGTASLQLALAALEIGRGDEVIVPNFTFAATINSVLHSGATPVLAEVDVASWTIDIEIVRRLITKRTKAIIPVHVYGQPCDMASMLEIASKHNLFIVEDFAEAFGAEFNKEKVGSIGHIGCTSFFANKIITTGEGGMCFTDDVELEKRMRILRDHGMATDRKYWHVSAGYNYRMTNLQAALGCGQIEQVREKLNVRKKIEELYKEYFSDSRHITFQNNIINRGKICWIVTVLVDQELSISPEWLVQRLAKHNIEARPLFFPLNSMPPYQKLLKVGSNISEELNRRGVSLPTFEEITEEEIERVATTFLRLLEE